MCGHCTPLPFGPDFAAAESLTEPILRGLCTFGMTGKPMVDRLPDGYVSRGRPCGAGFAGVVFPVETLKPASEGGPTASSRWPACRNVTTDWRFPASANAGMSLAAHVTRDSLFVVRRHPCPEPRRDCRVVDQSLLGAVVPRF